MKKILFLAILILIGITTQITGQVNGTAARPIVSTATTPVYYYIESASNGTVTAGSGTANYLGNLMYAPSATNNVKIKHNLKANITPTDNALWQIINDGGTIKLRNKGTNLYLTGSHTGVTSTTNSYIYSEYSTTTQYAMRTSDQASFTIAWGSNNLDRWGTSLGANSQTAWYFISPSELNTKIAEAVGLLNSTKAGVHPGQYSETNRNTFSAAIQSAVTARDNTDAGDDATALSTLNTAITTYQNTQNQLQVSSGSNEYWYWIKGTRGSTATALFAEFQSVGTQVLNKDKSLIDKQLWKIVANGSGYALQNKVSGAYMNTNIGNNAILKAETSIPSSKPVFFNKSTYATDAVDKIQYYLIEDNTTSSGVTFRLHASGSGQNWGLMCYTGGISDNCSFQFLLYDPNDVLSAAITDSEATYTKAVTGTNPGQYTTENKATFRAAIDAAIAVNISGSATSEQKTTAAATLNQAKSTFLTTRNPIKLSTAGNDVWYYIVSAHNGDRAGQVMTNQNSTPGTSILYAAKTPDPNKLWKFSDMGNGKAAIQNRASSLYISANPRNDGTTATAVGFNVTWLSEGAQLLMNADGQTYLHAQSAGTVIVTWGTSDVNSASAWRLEEIPAEVANQATSITSATVNQGIYTTTGRGNTDHGMAYATLSTSGYNGSVNINSLTIDLNGTSSASVIERLKLYATGSSARLNTTTHTLLSTIEGPFTTTNPITFSLSSPFTISAGTHNFYIAADIAEDATEGATLDNSILSVGYTDGNSQAQTIAPATTTTDLHSIVFLTRTVVIKPGDYGSVSYRIPALTTAPDGALVALTDKRKNNSGDLPADIDVIAQRSTDGGKTWSVPVKVAEGTSTSTGFGDAAIIRSNSGKLHALYVGGTGFFSSTAATPIRSYISTSTDNGLSWSAPRDITSQLYGAGCSDPVRAAWLGSFFGSGHALCLRDGRLMAVIAVRIQDNGIKNFAVYSDDDGLTWQVSNKAIDGGDEAKVVELDNGDILMSTRTSGNRLWTKSSDKGVNWTPQSNWTEIWGNACDADIIRYTSTIDDYNKSRLLHTLPNASDRRNLTIWMSEDEGTTWPTKKTICPGTSAYSSVTVLPDGTIGVYFEEDGTSAYTMTFVNFSLDWLTSGNESYQSPSAREYRTTKSGNWSDINSWEIPTNTELWVKPTQEPSSQATNILVANGHELAIDIDASTSAISVEPGAKLSISNTKTLTLSDKLTLKSDATGTATVTGNFSGNATVEQYLKSGTERTWWYLASPVTGAAWTVFGSNQVGEYSETSRSYSAPFAATETLTAGKGYVVKMNAAQAANVYQFANKALNNGNISVPLTRTAPLTPDDKYAKRGFNLVGNPYPSYLNWEMAYNASTNVRSTIWYRTKGTSAMEFHTYNAALGVSVPTAASGYIPPMQAFWVKVDTDPVSPATESTGTLNFTNAMRGHAIQGTTTPLKAPATNSLPLLRIALSNGSTSDETVIALHENASANFDQYDSEKMSNTGTSEVFTLAGMQELTINAQPNIEGSKLIPLGIRPANAGSLNLSVSELKNLDNMQIILHDNVLETETQLNLNESHNFTTDGTATNNRFSIEFRAPGMTTDLNNSNFADFNITVYPGKIQIQSPAMANGELIRVYSSNGQKIIEQTAEGNNTIIDHKLSSGVYFVKVSNYVQKIIIH